MKGVWRFRIWLFWPALAGLFGTLAIWLAVPVPYVVYEPGPVATTRPMVRAAAESPQEGAFLLTTVRWSYANVLRYAAAKTKLLPHAELFEKETITRGATRTEYAERQRLRMNGSHGNALEAAYRTLGVPYEVKREDIAVFGVIPGMAADGVLRAGDRLIALDGKRLAEDEDLKERLSGKRIGDAVTVTYRRGEEERTAELTLGPLPDADPPRPGMGISYGTIQTVESVDPAYRVDIEAGSIGGPSAGLMFALEIYDRFSADDWTKGYRIAGTGEISPDGTVGSIGGVAHKVVGAHRDGADLFFVPTVNAEAARRKAAELGTSMEIAAVGSLREALDYLAALPAKSVRTGGL